MSVIHIVGVGGIGSFLVPQLHQLYNENQLIASNGKYTLKVYDPDEVEQKNLSYQNFTIDDLFKEKAEAIGKRYKIAYAPVRIERFSDILKDAEGKEDVNDIVVCCVDNAATRATLFNEDLACNWIDLRSHGRYISMYAKSPKNTKEYLLSTLPKEEDKAEGSCQIKAELDAGIIQCGNRIIANIGVQCILNIIRGDKFATRFAHEF